MSTLSRHSGDVQFLRLATPSGTHNGSGFACWWRPCAAIQARVIAAQAIHELASTEATRARTISFGKIWNMLDTVDRILSLGSDANTPLEYRIPYRVYNLLLLIVSAGTLLTAVLAVTAADQLYFAILNISTLIGYMSG